MSEVLNIETLINENSPFLIIQEEAQFYLRNNEEDYQALRRYVNLAERYISNNEYAKGINLLRLYYEEYPAIQVAFKLAQSYFKAKQFDEAQYWIDRTKSDELRYKVGLLEAQILYEKNDWEASEQVLQQVYQKFQKTDDVIEMIGDIASAQGFYEKAQQFYLELFERNTRRVNLQEICRKILINESKYSFLNDEQLERVLKKFKNKEKLFDIYICSAFFNKEQYQQAFIYCQSALHQGIKHPYLYILHDRLAYRLNRGRVFTNTLITYLDELEVGSEEYLFLLEALQELNLLDNNKIQKIYKHFENCQQRHVQLKMIDYLLQFYFKEKQFKQAQAFLKAIQTNSSYYSVVAYYNGRLHEHLRNWSLAISYYDEASKALTEKKDVIHRLAMCYTYQNNYYLAWTILKRHQYSIYTYPSIQNDIQRLKLLDEQKGC